jgi:hypothetical protein
MSNRNKDSKGVEKSTERAQRQNIRFEKSLELEMGHEAK